MEPREISPPGISKDSFVQEYGEELLGKINPIYVISWNHQIYILPGWEDDIYDK